MAIYIVTYDLNTPGKDYKDLLIAIRKYTHCHALKSAFFVDSAQTAQQIRDTLMKLIDGNDSLYVMRLTGEWGSNRQMPCTAWLNDGRKF
ncbi:CRISPR-associated protein Cas2 [Mesorhizobium sp. M0254]|uniref:CRISPR-associated endonuclease Cas2 n=1 Tax=Mesorhizobium sp. M0254 TaxID=2956927 RepID=UPI003337BE52